MRIVDYLEISNSKKSIIFWSILSMILVMSLIMLYFLKEETYKALSEEDCTFENLTALFYFIAGVLMVYLCASEYYRNKHFKNIFLSLLLGIFFIFVAGEEISWGQRLIGIETPEMIKEVNSQNEISIHNLNIFMEDYGIDQHRLLNVFCLLMGVLIPIGYYANKRISNVIKKIHFPVLPLSCIAMFVLGILYGQTIAKIFKHYSHTEVKEFIFSIGYLIYSISIFRKKIKFD